MGKSSSQVVGYRYSAKFAAFIGNRIEKFLGINFDNRGWILHDPTKHPPNLLPVQKPNLYGETEGGVSGNIDIHFGTPNQEPNATYKQYFPLVSGYPYQSYLIFRGYPGAAAFTPESLAKNGFYLGNSGYMKEMLLWVKRIHVKNDGGGQWYDEKSEIGTSLISSSFDSEYVHLPVSLRVKCTWFQIDGDKSSELKGTFPLYDANQSYNGTFTSQIEGTDRLNAENTSELSRPPATIDTASLFNENGDLPKLGGGFIVPAVTWSGEGPPSTEGFVVEGISVFPQVRRYSFSGEFNWGGGVFDFAVGLGDNDATIDLYRVNLNGSLTFIFSYHNSEKDYEIYRNKINLDQGVYRISGGVGERYSQRPRPFVYFVAKIKKPSSMENPDINPIHKIREILTDDTAMSKPESDVNNANFIKAADRIWSEGLGISWAIDEKSCIEAIEELCYHIEAGIRVNRQTGLYEMVLFRDDWFAKDEIHDISESKIKDLSLEVMNSDDIVNQLNVTYYDRERIKNSTFSVYENGSILTMGHANAESVEFPYFMNMRNAEIVANWKLKQFSTPAWSGSFTTGWREARKWNRYDLIRLPWSSKWNGTILVRIMKINLGNGSDNTVTIDFEEVIPYSGEMNTSVVVDTPVDSGPQPPQPSSNVVFEAPYYLTVLRAGQTNADLELSNNPDIGYVAAVAAKPQSNSLNALLYTDGGVGEFEQVSRLDYCDILQLDQSITEITSSFVVTGSLTQPSNSNNFILLNSELMGFVSFNDETKVLTVKRGVLDTVPRKHGSGSLFVFDLPDVAFDSTQYAQSEVVEAQVLTTTPSGIQELAAGTGVEIQARAIRPYPPANVKLNDAYYPETILVTSDIVLTWVNRNRLQQTGGEILSFFDAGVTVESGTTYSYELISENVVLDSSNGINANTVTILSSFLIPNKPHTIKLWSSRDGYDSYQVFEHSFFVEAVSLILSATVYSDHITGSTLSDANISVSIDESLSANMLADGSGILGKSEAGATITIEIEE